MALEEIIAEYCQSMIAEMRHRHRHFQIKYKMINIVPINDLKEHTEDTTCECSPEIIEESGQMIIIHNAFDNREIVEQFTSLINKHRGFEL